ncbi:c-type cytochrome [Reichenbachiella carrageenanivorans]|uniref:C-type cytochrome n=1 Tax=Reichenbachiella carrageenanivorans TaxID=2979869 RepID=A0ABY6D2T4_9BACT|nr:c-type cytochrome [Reichenbachiella carrageenanivorans]UXX79935.1 c-type cytochrome [Reichenbachiella carrageenanivorans]
MSKKYSLHSRAGFLSTKTVLFLSLIFSVLFTQNVAVAQDADGIPTDEAIISAGEKLFKANCTVCHDVNDKVIGPALRDVHKRRNLAWIQAFVKNSQKVIKSGDEYAVNLYNEYNKTEMTAFDFSDEEIASIVGYIKVESGKEVVVAAEESTAAAGGASTEQEPSQFVNTIMIVLLIVLVLILAVLAMIITMLKKYLSQKEDLSEEDREIAEQTFDMGALVKSNAFLGLAAFIFTAIIMKSAIDGIFTIGVQQGYQPDQPIAFSHKIHAGDYKIDCNYCHTGVRKSKNANIPSPNICMNCHSSIKTESPEIQKIYAAIENNEPIEWVRIHNLPDLAYFNHSQHVQVGEIECQTCHGPIEEMEKVSQYAPLTMGWCINCHRETDVNTKGNDYYNKLVEMHSEHSKEPMKVEDIGGLECSKCHY